MSSYKQPWLYKSRIEWPFIIAPPFVCILVAFCFSGLFRGNSEVSTYWWVVLVLLIDVGHVYSTLYRTYFNPLAWHRYRQPMQWIPALSLVLFIIIYSISNTAFWTTLAYLAVFHFVRQQYGIFQLYRRKEQTAPWIKMLDITTIYAATLYPLLYWHVSGDRNFNWFIDGDFFLFKAPYLLPALGVVYILILCVYISKEIYLLLLYRPFNLPKNIFMLGTILSWYLGIVYFNGDIAFTLFNVVSHGIPYMALIWIYVQREDTTANPYKHASFYKMILGQYGILLFIGTLLLFAYVEEGLWDGILWKEHTSVFNIFQEVDNYIHAHSWMNILIPLLALPQITHYIIDGFIWKKQTSLANREQFLTII